MLRTLNPHFGTFEDMLCANGKWEVGLFNDLDGVVGALYLTRSADKAFVELYNN